MKTIKLFYFSLLFLVLNFSCFNIYALVDYSIPTKNTFESKLKNKKSFKSRTEIKNKNLKSKNTKNARSKRHSKKTGPSFILGSSYESLQLQNNTDQNSAQNSGQANETNLQFIGLHLSLYTPYDVSLHLNHYLVESRGDSLWGVEDASNLKMNPEAFLQFDWLDFGRGGLKTDVDFFVGYRLGIDNNLVATSRDDYLVGLKTSKQFYRLKFQLSYQHTFTGDPSAQNLANNTELRVGNLNQVEASLWWQANSNIKIGLRGVRYYIGSNNDNNQNALRESISYNMWSPVLNLTLLPSVHLNLEARFQATNQEVSSELLRARVFHNRALFGNSLYAGLNFII